MEERYYQLLGIKGDDGGGTFQNAKIHVFEALVRHAAELHGPNAACLSVRNRNIGEDCHVLFAQAVAFEDDLVIRVTDRDGDVFNRFVSNGFDFQPAAIDSEKHLRAAVDKMKRIAGGRFDGTMACGDTEERGVLIRVDRQFQNGLRQIGQFDGMFLFDIDDALMQRIAAQVVDGITQSVRISSDKAAFQRQ